LVFKCAFTHFMNYDFSLQFLLLFYFFMHIVFKFTILSCLDFLNFPNAQYIQSTYANCAYIVSKYRVRHSSTLTWLVDWLCIDDWWGLMFRGPCHLCCLNFMSFQLQTKFWARGFVVATYYDNRGICQTLDVSGYELYSCFFQYQWFWLRLLSCLYSIISIACVERPV